MNETDVLNRPPQLWRSLPPYFYPSVHAVQAWRAWFDGPCCAVVDGVRYVVMPRENHCIMGSIHGSWRFDG